MGNSSSKKAKAKLKAKQNKSNIAGGCSVVSAILIIAALAVNELVLYSVTSGLVDTTVLTRYGWDRVEVCTSIGIINDGDESCVGTEYPDSCDTCDDLNIDYDDCDACQYLNAGR